MTATQPPSRDDLRRENEILSKEFIQWGYNNSVRKIRVTNVVYFTEGHDISGVDLPTTFIVPGRALRGCRSLEAMGQAIMKAIESDWLVQSFDYQRPGDDAPTHYHDSWIGGPEHRKHIEQTAAFNAAQRCLETTMPG